MKFLIKCLLMSVVLGSLISGSARAGCNNANGDPLTIEFQTYPNSTPGPDKPHALNMDTRQNEEDHYAPYEKCVAHVWSSDELDLAQYLNGYADPSTRMILYDSLQWRVNGGSWQDEYELDLGDEPDADEITRFDIQVRCQDNTAPADHLLITVVPPQTDTGYEDWYDDESADTGWLAELPALYSEIVLSEGEGEEEGEPQDPETGECNFWREPHDINTSYHPDGHFEIRSHGTAGNHGHQACYSDDGDIILAGLSAGSADREVPFPEQLNFTAHINADVRPFVWAAQMDGNPVQQDGLTMTAPIMYKGAYLDMYFEVRPTIANDRPLLTPGNCP